MKTAENKLTDSTQVQRKSATPFFDHNTETADPFFAPKAATGSNAFFSSAKPVSIQPKLTVGQPNDKYEQEADSVADKVVQRLAKSSTASDPSVSGASGIHIQRKCAVCGAEDHDSHEHIQRKAQNTEGGVSSDIESRLGSSKGSGSPLPDTTRTNMESAMGADFSNVRVHTDSHAVQMSQDLNAHAFTHGSDVYFNLGKYSPQNTEGSRLLAHELTHTVQQGGVQKKIQRSLLFESTVNICRRTLFSREFKITKGGVRIVILPSPTDLVNCSYDDYWVTLMKPGYIYDDDISICAANTNGTKSFSIGGLSNDTYQIRIDRTSTNPNCCIDGSIFVFDEAVKKDDNHCERDKDPSAMDIVHGALDIAGFIPVLGAIPDGINAIIYVAEGDWANAGISAIAMIPAIGDGAKASVMAGKTVVKVSERTAIKLGEEGLAKAMKEAKAVHAAEEAAKAAKQLEKEAAEKLEKEAAERLEKETAARLEKEAAEKLEKEILECEAIWAAYKALGDCTSCTVNDTAIERAEKVFCLTALLAGRRKYLQKRCDYVLAGSIAKGSSKAEAGHIKAAEQIVSRLAKCASLPIKK